MAIMINNKNGKVSKICLWRGLNEDFEKVQRKLSKKERIIRLDSLSSRLRQSGCQELREKYIDTL